MMSEILTSLHGKQLGIDVDGYLTSPVGIKVPKVYVGTSGSEELVDGSALVTSASTAASISNVGLTWGSSAAGTFTLAAPTRAGLTKTLAWDLLPGTTTVTITCASGSGIGNANKTILKSTGAGPLGVHLVSRSTALWDMVGCYSTYAGTLLVATA
jgi:hypothetical protein